MSKCANIKYLMLAVLILLGVQYLLTILSSHPPTSLKEEPTHSGSISSTKNNTQSQQRAKAAFVILVRNDDLHDLRASMRELEDRFNHKFNYPYVFLNDKEFTDEFKRFTTALTNAETHYGLIPKEHWSVPDWVDYDKAKENMKKMGEEGVIYGGSESYRHMCRFESGFFFRHPLLDNFDYYWRVEPGVRFYCDIDFDPFLYMQTNGIKYSFTISLYEFQSTIKTLWDEVKVFMKEHPDYIEEDNGLEFISSDKGETYNLCHFWSNFEIADLNLWRSERYLKFFEFLDKRGGFFYERWGDAPVHTIAAVLFLKKSEIHFFNDIGYYHAPISHCPVETDLQLKCHCNPGDNFDHNWESCTGKWLELTKNTKPPLSIIEWIKLTKNL